MNSRSEMSPSILTSVVSVERLVGKIIPNPLRVFANCIANVPHDYDQMNDLCLELATPQTSLEPEIQQFRVGHSL